jgi:hypothetical protein
MARLDLSVDGPHGPERTVAAARVIGEAVRFLNYATMPASGAPGISYPGDVDEVLGAIQGAAGGLQQTLAQLGEALRRDLATGRLRLDRGRPHADDPPKAVAVACVALAEASNACGALQSALRDARSVTAGMYLPDASGG